MVRYYFLDKQLTTLNPIYTWYHSAFSINDISHKILYIPSHHTISYKHDMLP